MFAQSITAGLHDTDSGSAALIRPATVVRQGGVAVNSPNKVGEAASAAGHFTILSRAVDKRATAQAPKGPVAPERAAHMISKSATDTTPSTRELRKARTGMMTEQAPGWARQGAKRSKTRSRAERSRERQKASPRRAVIRSLLTGCADQPHAAGGSDAGLAAQWDGQQTCAHARSLLTRSVRSAPRRCPAPDAARHPGR